MVEWMWEGVCALDSLPLPLAPRYGDEGTYAEDTVVDCGDDDDGDNLARELNCSCATKSRNTASSSIELVISTARVSSLGCLASTTKGIRRAQL